MMSLARLVFFPLECQAWSLVRALFPSLEPRLRFSRRIFLMPRDLTEEEEEMITGYQSFK
jgi:hypothetical protein